MSSITNENRMEIKDSIMRYKGSMLINVLGSILLLCVHKSYSRMSSSKSTTGQTYVPLIVPNSQAVASTANSSSFNIFRMIINDGHRAKPSQPIVDLESDALAVVQEDVDESPIAKRRKVYFFVSFPLNGQSTLVPLVEYSVEENRVGSNLGSVLRDNSQDEEIICLSDLTVVDEELTLHESIDAASLTSSENAEIRVCSYNVLSELTASNTMDLYPHLGTNESLIKWENRWQLLKEELLRLDADVFGLQEVDCDHYESDFKPFMIKAGYAAFYKQGTGMKWDGCAVFVKKRKLKIINYSTVEYFVSLSSSMNRNQIGQILRLRCKRTSQEFIYANTHLLFNPTLGDIKLGQLAMLIANIEKELKKSYCPVILGGDLNIEPLSYIYTYISESRLYLRGLLRNELSGQGEHGGPYVQANSILPAITNIGRDSMFIGEGELRDVAADYFTHPLQLTSVYHHFNEIGEKEVSSYHQKMANPDFLFYSIKKKMTVGFKAHVYEVPELRLLRRLSLPGSTILKKTLGPWPNRYVPSDHIPLIADFMLSRIENEEDDWCKMKLTVVVDMLPLH
ncbi:endonuclease/exonuclease/phosphatase family protein [Dictyocaulus viviparus]|uniref:Endonuclease/exonuclease/phosphatase family protein n=1 Tax=Dictyocaulus viviparus TaxID=29172 RepID=A0A0D8X9R6_DICVI|nr:endonuclease/exonuclease/phosphatase family protein [Dictyocaulus viviparus]